LVQWDRPKDKEKENTMCHNCVKSGLYRKNDSQTLRELVLGFAEAMLWAEGLDADYYVSDIAPETVEKIRGICKKFEELTAGVEYERTVRVDNTDAECAGHDIYLTSRSCGTGFWEPGRWIVDGKEISGKENNPLYAACAKAAGQYQDSPYVGDDGFIHLP
jgi:hypothetical protein